MSDGAELAEIFQIAREGRGTDVRGYATAVGEQFASEMDAFRHYLAAGPSACPALFPYIDPAHYTRQLGSELPSSMTAFEHYVKEGAQRGLSPTPLFDPRFIRAQVPDLQCETVFDYLRNAAFASVDPHPFFSRRYYLGAWPDVAAAGADPFHHFIRHGWRERRAIHPFFRAEEYARFKVPADGDRSEFLAHLMAALASPELAFGQPLFDVPHYLQSLRADADPAMPIQHFVGASQEPDGSAFPLFDMEFFLSQAPDVRRGVNPYVEYLSDFSHAADPHPYFDRTFYRHSASVDLQFRGSLLEHLYGLVPPMARGRARGSLR